jgi:integrase
LADARRDARRILGDVARGEDPAEDKQARREAESFRGLAKAYLEVAEKRHRSWAEEKRIIEKDLLPAFGFRQLVDIRRRDVRELVESIARKRNAPIMANRTLGVLSRMFNFALDREWVEANPAARIPEPSEERLRDRVLTDEELRELWTALSALVAHQPAGADGPSELAPDKRPRRINRATAQAFQVQLLTAQRPGEVRSMRWSDIDLGTGWWSILGFVAKNAQPHRVPLTKPALDILKDRRRTASANAIFVFENRPGGGSIRHCGKKAASVPLSIADVHVQGARSAPDRGHTNG